MDVHFIGYSAGTVLFGFLVGIPCLWLGRLLQWDNPWYLPLAALTLIILLGVGSQLGLYDTKSIEDWIVMLGTIPSWIWVYNGMRRHGLQTPTSFRD